MPKEARLLEQSPRLVPGADRLHQWVRWYMHRPKVAPIGGFRHEARSPRELHLNDANSGVKHQAGAEV